jgi:AcrR family transcriptional regulator
VSVSPRIPGVDDSARRRILETALLLFAQHGYHGTSVRDLCGALGLQPGALYGHFESKEHVLAEIVRIGHEHHMSSVRAALLACGADPVEQVRAYVRAHVRMHADYAVLAVVANEEMHALSPELGAISRVLRDQAVGLLMDVISRGVDAGRFHPPHAWVTGAAIGGMGMRVAHWYRSDFELSPAELAEVHAELAVRMLGGSP